MGSAEYDAAEYVLEKLLERIARVTWCMDCPQEKSLESTMTSTVAMHYLGSAAGLNMKGLVSSARASAY